MTKTNIIMYIMYFHYTICSSFFNMCIFLWFMHFTQNKTISQTFFLCSKQDEIMVRPTIEGPPSDLITGGVMYQEHLVSEQSHLLPAQQLLLVV